MLKSSSLDDFLQTHQPRELRALREHGLTWMERLAPFRPHLTHDVWDGTANRDSDIWLSLFCDDSKSAELALINQGQDYEVGQTRGFNRQTVDVLSIHSRCPGLGEDGAALEIGVHLVIYDYDDLRGALSKGKRGDAAAVRALMNAGEPL
jgi:hypothetical protein